MAIQMVVVVEVKKENQGNAVLGILSDDRCGLSRMMMSPLPPQDFELE
jgi:hypothetical protein